MERSFAAALAPLHHVLAESLPRRHSLGHQRADADADPQTVRPDPHRVAGQGAERGTAQRLRVRHLRVGEAGESAAASVQHSRHVLGIIERRVHRVDSELVLIGVWQHERQLLLQDLVEAHQGEGGGSDPVDHR